MWYRLAKKLSDAHAAVASARTTAAAADGDDNAGEGSSKGPVTAGKKRKAAGAAQDGSTSGKGKISLPAQGLYSS